MPFKAQQMINYFVSLCNKKNVKNKINFVKKSVFLLALCSINLIESITEMKKIFAFLCVGLVCIFDAAGATREKTTSRSKNAQVSTIEKIVRTTTNRQSGKNTSSQKNITSRSSATTNSTQLKGVVLRPNSKSTSTRSAAIRPQNKKKNVTARAAETQTTSTTTETKTGAEYDQCKTAFFTCMDQFCELKNESFRRCSCSDRVYKFQDIYENYQNVNERLTEFTENLDVVGMTKEQTTAMKTASEGEDAMTSDKSASKQLLQAIMNAIRGDDASVGGKYKNLNSVSITSDMSNAFGNADSGQMIASYNGTNLYKAVFPKCRTVVQQSCNKSSLQRAINAYLMSIEQDCNTLESALQSQQKSLKAATHESSAMLDLARVENRRNHNSDDISTCISNIEKAIKADDVCGENYKKCLDNGQFINVSTGAPITGVIDFYKLGELLTFKSSENIQNQKLSSLAENRNFVKFFEDKTKKFAKDSLTKCSEQADLVWQQYLDMALIDIYYAQQSKVQEIQQNCFDLITACHENQSTAITTAMAALTGDTSILLKPAAINLTSQVCSNYIDSCNNMFNGNVVASYIQNKNSMDSETTCRAIAQQCFDKFGGTGYENFYLLQRGLFTAGNAIDWFTLYDENDEIISPCAQEIASIEGCTDPELLERVFGGFNKDTTTNIYTVDPGNNRVIRPTGVATEVYAKIMDNLFNQCKNVKGYFLEPQYAVSSGYDPNNFCKIDTSDANSVFYINPLYNSNTTLNYWYHFIENENMCPAEYSTRVDTQSWGVCSCWENGGYRSKNGTTTICHPVLPIANTGNSDDPICTNDLLSQELSSNPDENQWCQQSLTSSFGQLCPKMYVKNSSTTTTSLLLCANESNMIIETVLDLVPQHSVPKTVQIQTYQSEVEYQTIELHDNNFNNNL